MENENAQEAQVTTRSVGVKYGLIMGGIAILYFLVMTFADIDMSQGLGRWGSFLFYIALMVLAQKNYKDSGNGFMTYGQGMGIVVWMSLLTCAISSVFSYVYMKFVDTGYIQKLMDKQEEAMVDRGMSSDQVRQAMNMTEKFMTPEMILVFGLVFGFIMFLIVGLVVTIFTKKSNPEMPV